MQGWEQLLERAMGGIDALAEAGTPLPWWTFGGGTALMVQFQHRNSKDIDLFIADGQYITMLSPRLGGEEIWNCPDYDEQAHYLKLKYDEGEIDFIVSAPVTDKPMGTFNFRNWTIPIEHPVEIAIKKFFHRAEGLKPRDIFDIAVVASLHRDELIDELHTVIDKRETLLRRMATLPDAYYRQALDELDILPQWDHLKGTARECVMALVESIPTTQPVPEVDEDEHWSPRLC